MSEFRVDANHKLAESARISSTWHKYDEIDA